jgi:DNA-binding PadR family transcriptional regulator
MLKKNTSSHYFYKLQHPSLIAMYKFSGLNKKRRVPPHRTETLSFFILGLICMKPRTGYELKKIFQAAKYDYYTPPISQIYNILKKLKKLLLIKKNREVTDTKVHMRYYPTENGLTKFKEWLFTPITPQQFHWFEYEFTTKLFFSNYMSVERLEQFVSIYKNELIKIIEKEDASISSFQINNLNNKRNNLKNYNKFGNLTKEYVHDLCVQRITWCNKTLKRLKNDTKSKLNS